MPNSSSTIPHVVRGEACMVCGSEEVLLFECPTCEESLCRHEFDCNDTIQPVGECKSCKLIREALKIKGYLQC